MKNFFGFLFALSIGAAAILAAVFAVSFAVALVRAPIEANLQATCLERGYPSSRMAWDFSRYCVKRLDQTDVVVPLAETR